MVGAMPSTWLRPRKDEPGVLRQRAVEFKKTWKDYDYLPRCMLQVAFSPRVFVDT